MGENSKHLGCASARLIFSRFLSLTFLCVFHPPRGLHACPPHISRFNEFPGSNVSVFPFQLFSRIVWSSWIVFDFSKFNISRFEANPGFLVQKSNQDPGSAGKPGSQFTGSWIDPGSYPLASFTSHCTFER